MPTSVKYGQGYVLLNYEDGTIIRVTVEKKKAIGKDWKPWPIKDVASLAKALV